MQQLVRMGGLMDQHGVPSLTFRVLGQQGVEDRTVHRAQTEQASVQMQHLWQLCLACPVSNRQAAPGCHARLDYPVDDLALTVLREALLENAAMFTPPADGFVRTLVRMGWDGRRMEQLVRQLGAEPSPVGSAPVPFDLDGRTVNVTPYMVLEHLCFRDRLDPSETLVVGTWYGWFHTALGNRIAESPDPNAAARELFGNSASLGGLAALGQLIRHANQHGLGLLLDG
ncbi:hypothetical protein [Krasilnikovia sp. MM14-A1259]|uniref:hypothetical protein n=1 Tax=Krasilnikovia sp. MM14-A1259 TaxID=3373539 RepID=UPI00399CCF2A